MKSLKEITGEQILSTYIEMYGEKMSEADFAHFSKTFQKWKEDIEYEISVDLLSLMPTLLSLNHTSYLGKKTRALIQTIGMKEPKTLKILLDNLVEANKRQPALN